MSDESETDLAPAKKTDTFASRGAMWGRLTRLALKELRETLRDRRTILTLVLMPLIVYPLLSLAFQKFLLSSLPANPTDSFLVGVETEEAKEFVEGLLHQGEVILYLRRHPKASRDTVIVNRFQVRTVDGDLKTAVSEFLVDLGIRIPADVTLSQLKGDQKHPAGRSRRDQADRSLWNQSGGSRGHRQPVRYRLELVHLQKTGQRNRALAAVEQVLDAKNNEHRVRRLETKGVPRHDVPVQMRRTPVRGRSTGSPYSLSALIPLILILMTITGAVYPSIDLTAGERERGTLEMLVAAPVPRLGLLVAKYAAVLLVAILTATVNLVGMTMTILATGLGPILFGKAGLSLFTVVAVFGLMVLFAAFFSAVLLIFTSFARSFKEAQAYLIPLMLVSIAPGMMSMIPGLTLDGPLMVVPLANIVLLARDLFQDNVQPLPALIVVLSTVAYAAGALTLAARIFGTDAILYGSHGSWSDLFRRPEESSDAATLSAAMMTLVILFPLSILLSQWALRLIAGARAPMALSLVVTSLLTILLFGGLPLLVATYRRVRMADGFALHPSSPLSFAAAVLLGVSLWPFAYELVAWTQELGLVTLSPQLQELAKKLIADMRSIPLLFILLSYAVVPAVFEEFFFRGFLLTAVRKRMSHRQAIVVTAALFGLFHVVVRDAFAFERLLPSMTMGLVLGWVCLRTGSLFPGILLHSIHNGLLLSISHFAVELKAHGIGVEEQSHFPLTWLAGAAVAAIAGFMLMRTATPAEE